MVMARESGFARGILVPCICKTPCLDDRARHAHRLPMPGPLVAPEVGLEAWNGLEACRLHDAETGDAAPRRRDRPDVDGGHVFLRGREMARLRRGQADLVEQQRIMPAIVEKQE